MKPASRALLSVQVRSTSPDVITTADRPLGAPSVVAEAVGLTAEEPMPFEAETRQEYACSALSPARVYRVVLAPTERRSGKLAPPSEEISNRKLCSLFELSDQL